MKISSSVTTLSWIPSEAITGSLKLPFEVGVAHYDAPPPDVIEDLDALRAADRFRFANQLAAWIEIDDRPASWGGRALPGGGGRITRFGYGGGGLIGSTTLRLGSKAMTFAAVAYPVIQREPEVGDTWVKFSQTTGGRTGVPAPRPVPHPPFFQLAAPTAWTTLSLTLHTDGRAEYALTGASPFPRHWVYDAQGKLAAKSGLIDFKDWGKHAFGDRTPWGDEDAPALVTAVESELEREMSMTIMRSGAKPEKRKLKKGKTLTEQGEEGKELYLLLDGVLEVDVDGTIVAEVGPGAILGERALLEGGKRTSTLRALTNCTVVVADGGDIDIDSLNELAAGRRREEG